MVIDALDKWVADPQKLLALTMHISWCRTLDGIMLLPRIRERDFVGNTVPENMTAAEKRLEQLREATIADAVTWDW